MIVAHALSGPRMSSPVSRLHQLISASLWCLAVSDVESLTHGTLQRVRILSVFCWEPVACDGKLHWR